MRLSNGEALMCWPLAQHILTQGWNSGAHNGIDLRCTWGGTTAQPVYAAEDGTVDWVQAWDGHTRTGNQSYGNCVRILHAPWNGGQLKTLYAHLSSVLVQSGQKVVEGQLIGYTGNSGNSYGAHLHYEVWWGGKRTNPLIWHDDDFTLASDSIYTYGPGEHAVEVPTESTVATPARLYRVLDVSKHQSTFTPTTARAAGVDAVILRHAYGVNPDALALSWADAVKAARLPLGGYGFATWHYTSVCGGDLDKARAAMRAQVAAWIDAVRDSTSTGWWFAVDQELEAGQRMALGKGNNTALLNEACDILAAAGLHPCVYCSVAWDISYISTAALRHPQWMARYYDGTADFADAGADLDKLPDGQYTRWMRQLRDAGRLVGWQFASTGRGAQYGAGSANIDRSTFYAAPATVEAPRADIPVPVATAQYITIGPASAGDVRTVCSKLAALEIPCTVEGDLVRTDIPVSTGDQATLIALAVELCIGAQLADAPTDAPATKELPTEDRPAETPAETYSVIWLGLVVRGGFATAADAIDYIQSILGADTEIMEIKREAQ